MSAPASTPRLERDEAKLYLHAADGSTWRVHDVHFHSHRDHRVPLGSPRANHRIFVAADGTKRSHLFKGDESHAVADATLLARQLRGAGYLGREAFDPKSVEPERGKR